MSLPNGLDRGDGVTLIPPDDVPFGVATPANNRLVSGPNGATTLEPSEDEESPVIERGEQATLTHNFRMEWNDALTRLLFLGRGTVQVDSDGNATKILTSRIQHHRGGFGTLEVVSEGLSFDSPPDTSRVTPVELGIHIIKHPRYFYALQGATDNEGLLNQSVIRLLQNYFDNVTSLYRDWLIYQLYYSISTNSGGHATLGTLNGDVATEAATYTPAGQTLAVTPTPGTDLAKSAAMEIIQKYWRNEETPYIIGFQVEYTTFKFRPPVFNPGGYVENPMTEANPQWPDYFYSTEYPPDPTKTIFDFLTTFNPQCYSSTGVRGGPLIMSWLRKADVQSYNRTWFQVDMTWFGAPVGFWDPEFYTNEDRPLTAGEYLQISPNPIKTKPAGA